MTTTLDDVTARKKRPEPSAEQRAAEELVRRAREQGLSLTGPDGLLKQLTKTVLETCAQSGNGGTVGAGADLVLLPGYCRGHGGPLWRLLSRG